ncbi:RNA polymerase sigma factor [Dysgonomonas macrotermitis]|uniref:RNA polymerase sigma-70 factor, ECF subfamily n=1 Tax=Dysgonomonas macrotermitis TaxID=1346286 RepID=A0A1M4TQW0_9BACT|nr:sigma-70 family RNA polymerase sigma factor [Dysgonomonas macrotermitis]SHE46774.1 RNA polymerase sigma-70 factor, ECF subfamily [Dysgonomonas macrotermitis]
MNNIELESSFIDMIRKYERVIYKVCSFYVTDEYPMADLYQDVVCNLWKGYPVFRRDSSESTWIYKIALNTCISGLRKTLRKPQKVSVSLLEGVLMEPENMEDNIKEMYRLVYKLKNVERALILLYLEEKSYKEIAEITGLSLSNVATKLKRIKLKLREMSNIKN